jgi:hypothetical protein
MSFRQSGQSDDRRRRVLRDDGAKRPTRDGASSSEACADASVDGKSAEGKSADRKTDRPEGAFRRIDRPKTAKRRAYNAAALVEGQLRLIDLIPVRAWTLSVLILLVLTAISGQAVLYLQWPKWGRWLGRENLAFVDLSARDSLAGWFSAMLLAIAAIQCLFIYSLRRYRSDDYRGRYRIWLSACAIVLLASADAVAGWGRGLCGLATHLGAIGGNISPESCGRLVWTIVFAVGAGRMLFEMRRSLAAVAWLLVAGACYTGSLVLLSPGFNVAPNQLTSLGRAVCLLLGHASLLFTALFYARRVFLEAHGHIAAPLAGASRRSRKSTSGKKTPSTRRPAEAKPASESEKVATAKSEVVVKKDERKPPAIETTTPGAARTTPAPAKPQAQAPSTPTSTMPAKTAAATPTAAAPSAAAPSAAKPAAAAKPAEAPPARLSPLARLLGKGKAAATENNSKKADEKSPQNEKPGAKPASASAAKPGLHVKSVDDDEDEDDDQDASDDSSKLSKAERRRLKKEQRRDRRAAA